MKTLHASLPVSFLLVGLICLQAGCINEDIELWAVTLEITVVGPKEELAPGFLFVELHQQTTGEGALEYPLALIEAFEVVGQSTFTHSFDYPAHAGFGLVVYVWRDLDEDGLLCAPGASEEPVGASLIESFEDLSANAIITLNQACIGPERFVFTTQRN